MVMRRMDGYAILIVTMDSKGLAQSAGNTALQDFLILELIV
jgi:hypothetical protein